MVASGEVLQQLREWAERAKQLRVRDQYTACLRAIYQRLMNDPAGWGNPQKNLPGLNMVLYHGADRFLYVRYGVNEPQRIVFVQGVKLMDNTPLTGSS